MRNRTLRIIARAGACLIIALAAGCASTKDNLPAQPPAQQVPLFPPQAILQGGDYEAFFTENETALKSCNEPDQCAVALFNISFLYCYSPSPYYNPARGRLYLEDLIKGAPESPLAYHARVWLDLLKKSPRADTRKRPVPREDPKSKEAAAAADLPKQAENQQESAPETDRQRQESIPEADRLRMEEEIRTRDETIRELNRQLERSRQIDIEIEKKQRGLAL
ncbi:MAG: hypothetical protein WAW37_09870 [Syntrophobacteraceae bacterium]